MFFTRSKLRFEVIGGAAPIAETVLPLRAVRGLFPRMSTLQEIEAAIAQLPPPQVEEVAEWLSAYRARRSGGKSAGSLASLAGSWQEDAAFDAAVQAFEQVDESMWR